MAIREGATRPDGACDMLGVACRMSMEGWREDTIEAEEMHYSSDVPYDGVSQRRVRVVLAKGEPVWSPPPCLYWLRGTSE